MIAQIFASIIGVLAFAILFHAPRRSYFFCAFCGGFSWALYLLFSALGLNAFLSSTLAVVGLTILARVLSVGMELPATVFIVTGIFPIVPGAGIYNTAYGLLTSDMELFRHSGMLTLALAGAIAIGILIGMGMPAPVMKACGKALGHALPKTMRKHPMN